MIMIVVVIVVIAAAAAKNFSKDPSLAESYCLHHSDSVVAVRNFNSVVKNGCCC